MSTSVDLPHLGTSESSCTVQPQVMISSIIAIFGGFSGALRHSSAGCNLFLLSQSFTSMLEKELPYWHQSPSGESWPFSSSLPSEYSPRYPPTVLDQKKARPFMEEEWTPMSYKINFVPSPNCCFLPKWHTIIPRQISAQGKAIKSKTTAKKSCSVKCHDLLMLFYLACLYF